jgi:ribosomal protein S18 acetylase RimI-like enzyme
MPPIRIALARSLASPSAPALLPKGYRMAAVGDGRLRSFHALLATSYEEDGEAFPAFAPWWSEVSSNSEFDPALCLAVFDPEGNIAALAHCWSSGFLREIAVAREQRRRGLARALLLHLMALLRERGLASLRLKVEQGNRHGAEALYRSLGFRPEKKGES